MLLFTELVCARVLGFSEFNLIITFCGFIISILLIEKEKLERLSILPKVV